MRKKTQEKSEGNKKKKRMTGRNVEGCKGEKGE
jgi:hypothetical protein